MRDIRPKQEPDREPSANSSSIQQTAEAVSNKRKCISSACIPCRKRKSKCDGGLPVCSTCTAVYHTDCSYDLDSDHRRKAALKRDIQALKEENGALGVIIASIKGDTEETAQEIVRQLRNEVDLDSLAEYLKNRPEHTHPSVDSSAEHDLGRGRTATDGRGRTKHFGTTSNLGIVPEIHPARTAPSDGQWTNVTADVDLIKHLFRLYFCWVHPFFRFFSKDDFLHDYYNGMKNYCSELLVNAILANASHLSDRPELRRDPKDPRTAGENFYEEAKRLLDAEESCLTTVQALAILGQREPSCGRDSTGYSYSGRAARMAIELGLHITLASDGRLPGPTELEVRRITFWGVFITETLWSACVGRQTPLPTAAIDVQRPAIVSTYEAERWIPYTDYGIQESDEVLPENIGTLTDELISLCRIVSDMLTAFYAPRERFTSTKLLKLYGQFTQWFKKLPSSMHLQKVTTPHVITLHMLYHCLLTMMCRAFFQVDLVRSEFSPRQICYESANDIACLWSFFRRLYTVRQASIITSHISLSAAIMDLKNLPYHPAAQNLVQGIYIMREAFPNHGFQQRNLDIILALSKQWRIPLPPEVQAAAHSTVSDTGVALICFPSGFASDTMPPSDVNSGPIDDLAQTHHEVPLRGGPPVPENPRYANMRQKNKLHPPHALPASPFWSPFPTQSLPIQATPPSQGPMALDFVMVSDSMAAQSQTDSWEQLGKDGFAPASASFPASYLPPTFGHDHLNGGPGWQMPIEQNGHGAV